MTPINEINGFQVRLGNNYYFFNHCETPFNNQSCTSIGDHKYIANQLLERAGIPVPKGVSIHVSEFEQNIIEEKIALLSFPLVVKPILNSGLGRNVLCNIKTIEDLYIALKRLFLSEKHLLVEEFHAGLKSYRVLVFNKKVIGVVRRYPASVVGDGIHSIRELADLYNDKRKATPFISGCLIALNDDEAKIKLKELGINTVYIPLPGERIVLGYTCNATRGGSNKPMGKQICKENRKLMIKTASVLNVNFAGIDIECTDINLPIGKSSGVVIEVNIRPSVEIHECPIEGRPHLVTRRIMRSLIYSHPFHYFVALCSHKLIGPYLRIIFIICVLLTIYYI